MVLSPPCRIEDMPKICVGSKSDWKEEKNPPKKILRGKFCHIERFHLSFSGSLNHK